MSADASHERFDPLLLNIATTTSGIDELLDIFLGFLRRKTDAFTPPGGFPQLRDSFVASLKRQFDLAQAAKAAKEAKASKQAAPAAGKVAPPTSTKSAPVAAAPAADIIEKGASGAFDISGGAAADTAVSAAADTLPTSAPSVPMPHAGERAADTGPLPSDSLAAAAAITTSTGAAAAAAAPPLASDAAPSPAAAGAGLATPVPGGNGGTTDRYSWSQTLGEVTLVFPLPAGIKTKDITADIKSRSLRVHIRGAATPLIDGALPKRIKTDDSYWTLDENPDGGKSLTVYLTKENGMDWWSRVAENEPEIDVTKIQPENSKLSDLDSDTRKTVEKMMFDQRQKASGKPTSDELQKQELMEKFMKSHPEMDFSKAKFM